MCEYLWPPGTTLRRCRCRVWTQCGQREDSVRWGQWWQGTFTMRRPGTSGHWTQYCTTLGTGADKCVQWRGYTSHYTSATHCSVENIRSWWISRKGWSWFPVAVKIQRQRDRREEVVTGHCTHLHYLSCCISSIYCLRTINYLEWGFSNKGASLIIFGSQSEGRREKIFFESIINFI